MIGVGPIDIAATVDVNHDLDHTVGMLADLLEVLAVLEPRLRQHSPIEEVECNVRQHINQLLDQEMAVDVVEHTVERLKDGEKVDALATFAYLLIDRARRPNHSEQWW